MSMKKFQILSSIQSYLCNTKRMSRLGGNVNGKVKVKGKVVVFHVMKA